LKVARLIRFLKIAKSSPRIAKFLDEQMKLSKNIQRISAFLFGFFMICHFISCFWILVGRVKMHEEIDSWMVSYSDLDNGELYGVAFYYAITTMSTVGYGDISGKNTLERITCMIVMIIGVVSFSFFTGAISSVITNSERREEIFNQKIENLNKINIKYNIGLELYQKIRQSFVQNLNSDLEEVNEFIKEVPAHLQGEVARIIHRDTINKIDFFFGQTNSFIGWVCPLLKPYYIQKDQMIYYDRDMIDSIYFIKSGKVGFVLPKYKNAVYVEVEAGTYVGMVDLVGSVMENNLTQDNMFKEREKLRRQFSCMAVEVSECLGVSIMDLERMEQEFPESFDDLYDESFDRLKSALAQK
jgi:CRP-like cAMP-binding protein